MLMPIQFPVNASMFFGSLLQVAAFDFIPTDSMFIYIFDIDMESSVVSENFSYLGYETRQFLYNAGSLSLVIFMFLPFLLFVFLVGLLPCDATKKWSTMTKNAIFFTGIF